MKWSISYFFSFVKFSRDSAEEEHEEEDDICIRLHSCSSQCFTLVSFVGYVSILGISSFEELCVILVLKASKGLSNKRGFMPFVKCLWSVKDDCKGRDLVGEECIGSI